MALALHRAKIRCRLCPVCTEYVAEKTTTTAKVCNCVIRMASPDAIPLQLRHLGLSLSPDPHEPPLPQGQRCFLIKDKAAHTPSHRTAPPFALFYSACCRFCASKSSLRCRLLGAATRYPSTQRPPPPQTLEPAARDPALGFRKPPPARRRPMVAPSPVFQRRTGPCRS
jgi:hypothetical protein